MSADIETQLIMVPLRVATVAQLISLRANPDESLDRTVTRLTAHQSGLDTTGTPPEPTASLASARNH